MRKESINDIMQVAQNILKRQYDYDKIRSWRFFGLWQRLERNSVLRKINPYSAEVRAVWYQEGLEQLREQMHTLDKGFNDFLSQHSLAFKSIAEPATLAEKEDNFLKNKTPEDEQIIARIEAMTTQVLEEAIKHPIMALNNQIEALAEIISLPKASLARGKNADNLPKLDEAHHRIKELLRDRSYIYFCDSINDKIRAKFETFSIIVNKFKYSSNIISREEIEPGREKLRLQFSAWDKILSYIHSDAKCEIKLLNPERAYKLKDVLEAITQDKKIYQQAKTSIVYIPRKFFNISDDQSWMEGATEAVSQDSISAIKSVVANEFTKVQEGYSAVKHSTQSLLNGLIKKMLNPKAQKDEQAARVQQERELLGDKLYTRLNRSLKFVKRYLNVEHERLFAKLGEEQAKAKVEAFFDDLKLLSGKWTIESKQMAKFRNLLIARVQALSEAVSSHTDNSSKADPMDIYKRGMIYILDAMLSKKCDYIKSVTDTDDHSQAELKQFQTYFNYLVEAFLKMALAINGIAFQPEFLTVNALERPVINASSPLEQKLLDRVLAFQEAIPLILTELENKHSHLANAEANVPSEAPSITAPLADFSPINLGMK